MTTIRIIGIDPGLRRTGWGVIDWDGARMGYVASGAVTSDAGDALATRLCALFAGLDTVLSAWEPREAAVEQTFMTRDGQATLKLGQARGVALLAPARAGLTVAEYAPNLIKKTVTGAGHAEKEQIRVMLGFLLPRAKPESADEADALAVAITHAHHRRAAQIVAAAMAAQPRKARA